MTGSSRTSAPAASDRRSEIVQQFRRAEDALTALDVAEHQGIHVNTARFHLEALVEQGTLHRDTVATHAPGRPRVQYRLTPGMDRAGRRSYELLARMLLTHLSSAPDAAAASRDTGRAWGGYLVRPPVPGERIDAEEALRRLLEVLDDVGFDPSGSRNADGEEQIELRHCPFLELAENHADLICTMHFGVMQGALSRLNAPLVARRIVPFADPHTCLAFLGPPAGTARRRSKRA